MVLFSSSSLRKLSLTAVAFGFAIPSATAGLFCHWCVEPLRPYCSPACEPTWGVHVASWKQFPEHRIQGDYCPTCQTGGKLLADRSLSRLLKDDWPDGV